MARRPRLAAPACLRVSYVRKGLNLPMQLSSAAGVVSRLQRLVFENHQPIQFLDLTDAGAELVRVAGLREGVANVFSRPTTAALCLHEAEPPLLPNLRHLLERRAPAAD